jgi:Cu(I)/Ag(I) efflux system membrane fusion protein
MHPQIKQDKPGDCPICGMDLIPLQSMQAEGDDIDPNEIMMTESAAKLAEIQTLFVSKGTPQKSIYVQGKIEVDERNISVVTARFNGRIEKLFVNFKGQKVAKGEKLATLYSPELVSAQKELIEALSMKETHPSLYKAAVSKLKLWDLNQKQIEAIETNGEPMLYFDVLSPISGTVTMRHVAIGDYVKQGETLLQVTDLSEVWVMFDAYENDLPWIKLNDKVSLNFQAIPGKEFSGKVNFIDPFLDAKTRVAQVRVELNNKNEVLKPEMFANGIINSTIAAGNSHLLIPKSSILWTGKRAVVYVKVQDRESPSFIYREITLGAEAGNFYVVADGLSEGEEIATNGVFKIDAAAQLQGLPSMMNPGGGAGSTPHDMSKMGDESMSAEEHQSMNSKAKAEQVMIKVAGNCDMCKDRIESAALSVTGVKSANWDAETQMLNLNYDAAITTGDDVQKAIAKVGHDTEKFKADDSVFAELPGCCLYERLKYKQSSMSSIQKSSVRVAGNCDMCKDRIETAALSVTGVQLATWEAETQQLNLKFNAAITNTNDVQKAIAKAGHDTEKFKADDSVYNELPGCCLYERMK